VFWIPLASCAFRVNCTDPLCVDPLLGLVIASVGLVRSSVICTIHVFTIPLNRLVNVVLSVLSHSPVDKITSTLAVLLNVAANIHCVAHWMIYPAGSVT